MLNDAARPKLIRLCLALGALATLSLCSTGCGKHHGGAGDTPLPPLPAAVPNPLVALDPTKHVVMIEDDGFDLGDPVFQGKIVGEYTLTCADSGSPSDQVDLTLPIDQLKAAFIAAYNQTDTSCQLATGLTFTPAADFASVVNEQPTWNQDILTKTNTYSDDDFNRISDIVSGDSSNVNYHGTATSGLLAYGNTAIQLVVVEESLGTPDAPVVSGTADCPTQAQLDAFVTANQDAAVNKAFLASPVDAGTAAINALQKTDGVAFLNLSLGSEPLAVFEQELQQEGCGTLNYAAFFALSDQMGRAQLQARLAAGQLLNTVMTVQAAGNDGVQIDDLTQTPDCSDNADNIFMVGAVNSAGTRSTFSNYGKCVDVFNLGEAVVTAAPRGFVNVEDGTSFSTPLTLRYFTQTYPVGAKPADMMKDLKSKANAAGVLPNSAYPTELAFTSNNLITAYSLLGEGGLRPARRHWRTRRLQHAIRAGGGVPALDPRGE